MPIKFLNSGLLEGSLQLTSYGGGSISGTGTYNLGVDASGNVIETSLIEGSGTANYVVKWTPDGNTLGDSVIYDDGTDVGIDTTNPTSKLQVNTGTDINAQIGLDSFGSFKLGDVSGNYAGKGIYYDGTAGSEDLDILTNTFNIAGGFGEGIRVVSGSDVQLLSPAGVVITIDGTSSNVGIGTTSPDTKLEVAGADGNFQTTGHQIFLTKNGVNEIYANSGANPGLSQLAIGTNSVERMRINSSGRVGIATTNPLHRLQIGDGDGSESLQVSAASVSGLYLSTPNSTAQSVIGFGNSQFATINTRGRILYQSSTTAASNYMQFTVAFNEAMRLTSDSLGIGTTNPSVALDVDASTGIKVQNQGDVVFEANPSGTFSLGDSAAVGGGAYITSDSSNIDFFGDGDVRFQNEGNVGIGTNNPDRSLVVNHATDSRVKLQVNGTDTAQIQALSNQARYHALGSSTSLQLWTNGGQRMHINTSGNVGINYTNPQQKLEVSGASRFSRTGAESAQYMEFLPISGGNILKAVGQDKALIFDNTSSTNNFIDFRQGSSTKMRLRTGTLLIGKTSFSTNTAGIELNPVGLVTATRSGNLPLLVNRLTSDGTIVSIRRDNVQRGSISVSGSTTSYNTSSDYRLKENVVDLTGALDRVEQLQPKRFNFISEETTVDGFIAHEVQDIIPQAVFGEKDAVDEEGNPEYQGIDNSKIVPLLVGAIKELKAEIETLKSQINS